MSGTTRMLIYYTACITFGVFSALIERYFRLADMSVLFGAGLPVLIIFKPWKFYSDHLKGLS